MKRMNRPPVYQVQTILARRNHRNVRVHVDQGLDGKEHLFVDIKTTSKDKAASEIRAVLHTLRLVGLYVVANAASPSFVDPVHAADECLIRCRGFFVEIPPDWHGPNNWPAWFRTALEEKKARSWSETLNIIHGG